MSAAVQQPPQAFHQASPAQAPAASPEAAPAAEYDETVHRGNVEATFNFFKAPADGSVPFNYVEKPPEGEPQRNYTQDKHTITVHDVRGHEAEFSVDAQGFEVVQGVPEPGADFESDDSIKDVYYAQVKELLLNKIPRARKVVVFDHTIRHANPTANRQPVQSAHVDQTVKSLAERVQLHAPEEVGSLPGGGTPRARIVNVWRPLNGAVVSSPLAFADARSVGPGDVVPVEHRYPHRTGETAAVKYVPGAQWWYLSGIANDERVLLQCADSGAPLTRTPHSAFVDPRSSEAAKPRSSIEVRMIVFE